MKHAGEINPRLDQPLDDALPHRTDRSFTRKIALRMTAFASFASVVVALFSFGVAERQAERALLAEWQTQIAQRGRYESQRFQRAESLTDRFAAQFLGSYIDPDIVPSPDFAAYFEERADGTIRLRPEYHSGVRKADGIERSGVSGFIARNRPPLDDELRRRLVLTYQAIAEFGPGAAASGEFANVHASLPENALIIHWPEEAWGLDAASDLDMTALSVVRATLPSVNPERNPVWTGLYFDATAGRWTITFERPVDWQGRHLINPSVDVGLNDLIGSVVRDQPRGVYDLLLSREGKLIAFPGERDRLRRSAGQISIAEFGDPAVESIYRDLSSSARNGVDAARVDYSQDLDAYVASVPLDGPDWWLVTVYPHGIVEGRALRSAGFTMFVIALLFGAFILTVLLVLRASVAVPLHKMTDATRMIAEGDYASVANGEVELPTGRDDEIGTLARSFRRLARKVDHMRGRLEQMVTERTIELELANQQLAEQSLRDALTGALNRRAFDQDLKTALHDVASNEARITLALFDVDFFKAYNDCYGHVAGDKALERIVSQLAGSLPDATIYRYGGEEIAAIVPSPEDGAGHAAVRAALVDIERLDIPHAASPFGRLTVSAGTLMLDKTQHPASALRQVDKALYAAKEAGRNRCA